MRWPVLVVLLASPVLPGCFDCPTVGQAVDWTQPGMYEAMAGLANVSENPGWAGPPLTAAQADGLPPEQTAAVGVRYGADGVWITWTLDSSPELGLQVDDDRGRAWREDKVTSFVQATTDLDEASARALAARLLDEQPDAKIHPDRDAYHLAVRPVLDLGKLSGDWTRVANDDNGVGGYYTSSSGPWHVDFFVPARSLPHERGVAPWIVAEATGRVRVQVFGQDLSDEDAMAGAAAALAGLGLPAPTFTAVRVEDIEECIGW